MRKLLFLFVLPVFVLAGTGCDMDDDSGYDTLLVGLVDVSEMRFSFFNESLAINTRLALADSSENGVLTKAGKKVRIQFLTMPMVDKPEAPRQTIYETVNTYGAQVIIGGARSKTAVNMARAAEELHVPFLATTATAPAVTKGTRYTFTTSPSTDVQAVYYAFFLHNILKIKRIALLVEEDTLFAADFADALRLNHMDNGGQISAVRYFSTAEDIPSRLPDLVDSEPEAIVFCAIHPHSFVVGRRLEELGFHRPLLSIHSRQAFTYLEHMPQPDMPVYYLSYWNPADQSSINREYVRNFKETTGREPTEDDAMVYDTMLRLIQAVRDAESLSPDALQKSLALRATMSGAVGHYSFIPETTLQYVWSLGILDGKLIINEIHSPLPKLRQH